MKATGKIEVICGPMSSGKSDELIRLIRRFEIAGRRVIIFKPEIDTRDISMIVSRSGCRREGIWVVKHSTQILELCPNLFNDADVVAIDEAQFLDHGIVDLVESLVDAGIDVLIAGLDKDCEGKGFGCMPFLLAIADHIRKLDAVCMKCKRDGATFSFRKVANRGQIVIGGDETYEARCRGCWLEDGGKTR